MKSLLQINLIKAPFDISWLLEKDILRISKILTSRGANLYAVGGSVRASYWKEEFDNIDFAINITPHEVKELLKNIKFSMVPYRWYSIKNYLKLLVLEKILKRLDEKQLLNTQIV